MYVLKDITGNILLVEFNENPVIKPSKVIKGSPFTFVTNLLKLAFILRPVKSFRSYYFDVKNVWENCKKNLSKQNVIVLVDVVR